MTEYDYVSLHLRAENQAAIPTVRGELVQWLAAHRPQNSGLWGLFVPQLGWSAWQVVVFVERNDAAAAHDALVENLAALPQVHTCHAQRLIPTLRAAAGARMTPGGIYVHRWFDVHASDVDEFVALSGEGWQSPDFESTFDARMFGLFREVTDQPQQQLLLLTRYGSHAVWEASRVTWASQADWEASGKLAATSRLTVLRRMAITRDSTAASTQLMAL
jgi:hypothetical protein